MIRHYDGIRMKPKLEPAVLESGILLIKISIFIRIFDQKRLKNAGIPAVVRFYHFDEHMYTLLLFRIDVYNSGQLP
jgi:hypothetical protein